MYRLVVGAAVCNGILAAPILSQKGLIKKTLKL